MSEKKKKYARREGLTQARIKRGLSADGLASLMELNEERTVLRWESGETTPHPRQRPLLAKHLGIALDELALLLEENEKPTDQLPSMIPSQRNPYFIGRDTLLDGLRAAFLSETGIQKQLLTGQSGIGKTQIAIEYTYRYAKHYQTILWATAETTDRLIADFVQIASLLHLPEQDNPSKPYVVEQVKLWLSNHSDWLLIFDNVDNPNLLDTFFPHTGQGHILLTACDPEVGTPAITTFVEQLGKEDGLTLLLRRSKTLSENGLLSEVSLEAREKAEGIAQEMDGHPLALDQAGAYIAEAPCTLQQYFELYQKHRDKLLKERGRRHFGYPLSLAATILLSFEQVERTNYDYSWCISSGDSILCAGRTDLPAIPRTRSNDSYTRTSFYHHGFS